MGMTVTNLEPTTNSQKSSFIPIRSVRDIMSQYDLYIVDLWGVIYDGLSLFPHAQLILKELKKQQKEVVLITNNSRRSTESIHTLEKMGLDPTYYDRLISAGEKAFHLFTTGQIFGDLPRPIRAYVFDFDDPTPWVEEAQIERVYNISDAQLILGLHIPTTLSSVDNYHLLLNKALKLKLPFVCCNPDLFVTQNNRKIIRVGSLGLRYENMGGPVIFIGKPYPTIYEDVFKESNGASIPPSRTLIIGDSLTTDIRGAHNIGVDSLLITSGYHAVEFASPLQGEKIFENVPYVPKYICPHFY